MFDVEIETDPVQIVFACKHEQVPEHMAVEEHLHCFLSTQKADSFRELGPPEKESNNDIDKGTEESWVDLSDLVISAKPNSANDRCHIQQHLSRRNHEHFVAVH